MKISDDDIKNASVLKQAWSSGLLSYEEDLLLRKIFSLKRISPGDSAWLARARARFAHIGAVELDMNHVQTLEERGWFHEAEL